MERSTFTKLVVTIVSLTIMTITTFISSSYIVRNFSKKKLLSSQKEMVIFPSLKKNFTRTNTIIDINIEIVNNN